MATDSSSPADNPGAKTKTVWHFQGKLCTACCMQRNRTSIPAWLETITKIQAEMAIPRHTADSAWRRLCQAEQDSESTEGGSEARLRAAQEVGYAGAFGVTAVLKGMVRWIRHCAHASPNAWDTHRKEECAKKFGDTSTKFSTPSGRTTGAKNGLPSDSHAGTPRRCLTAILHQRKPYHSVIRFAASQLCDQYRCASNRFCACCKMPWCEQCAEPEQPCEGCGQPRPCSRPGNVHAKLTKR